MKCTRAYKEREKKDVFLGIILENLNPRGGNRFDLLIIQLTGGIHIQSERHQRIAQNIQVLDILSNGSLRWIHWIGP